jgi:hypothetical protein
VSCVRKLTALGFTNIEAAVIAQDAMDVADLRNATED